jgi:hypothetical protein
MPPPPHRDAPLASLAFCLALGALVRLGMLWGLDLRGAFGPDAPGAAAAAFSGILAHPYPLHPLLIRVFALPSGDGVQGALLLSITAGLATVAAAWLLGRVLTGGRDGRSTALIAAAAPLLVQHSLLRGGDALAVALVAWGVALGWWGGQALIGAATRARGPRVALVAAGLLWGLSAAAKPIALPAGTLLLLVPLLGGRRCLPWLGAGLLGGSLLALPFLGPLLRPEPALGLLGSWWLPGSPGLVELPAWLWAGVRTFTALMREDLWTHLATCLGLAVLGCVVAAPRRGFRVGVLLVSAATMILLAAMLGERLQPRYLAAASLGWLLLAGVGLTPRALRHAPRASRPTWRQALLGPLPLSLFATLCVMSNLRLWDGLCLLRAGEEGTTPPQGMFAGWAGDWRPHEAYADSSICGALELEALAETLVQQAPRGGAVLTLPLRDGRAWHLLGPLAAQRPDLTLLELGPECCGAGPEACAVALPEALSRVGGGSLVVPLDPPGRCLTGSLPHGQEPWREALLPLVGSTGFWFGELAVAGSSTGSPVHLCEALGGRAPAPPAHP